MKDFALIFDMDGVIVDSNPVHALAWRAYLEPFGLTMDNLASRMYGRHNDELVREIFGGGLSDEEVRAHGAAKEALYREFMRPQLGERLAPGLVEFLEKRRGVPMAVATNAEPLNVSFVLGEAGLADRFAAVVDGHQVERPKPHPDVFLRAAEMLKVPPANCVIFEDSYAGMMAARAAGARVIGVTTTHAELPDADFCIRDFCDPELDRWLSLQRRFH